MHIQQKTFGRFTEYVLSNPETQESVAILPELGGIVRQLWLKNDSGLHRIIQCGDTQEELLNSLPSYPSTHLFPWGNRIKNGQYTFEGTAYQLPINEVPRQNALHGFVYYAPFQVITAEATANEAILTLGYTYKGGYFGYPFPFQLSIQHTLSAQGLTLTYTIENTGESNMPVSLGWHPYFSIEGESKSDWTIAFPSTHQYLLDEQMCPIDRFEQNYATGVDLATVSLDAVFAVTQQPTVEAVLSSKKQDIAIHLWQEAASEQFNYTIVYTPDSGQCVAIEPMTAPTNAFNSTESLWTIPVAGSKSIACGVYVGNRS